MADGEGAFATRVVVRKLVFTAIGVFLVAAGITVVFEGMRTVMDIGGYCASGGPYEIRQECPDNAWLIPVGIFVGLAGVGFMLAGMFRGGPKLVAFAWSALFLALGWNFLEYAFDPPPPDDGIVWGWLICGVVFVVMGGVPLLVVLANAKLVLWGVTPRADAPTPTTLARLTAAAQSRKPTFVRYGNTTVATATGPPPEAEAESMSASMSTSVSTSVDDDLVSDLERLAELHRDGQLTDDEYTRAKDARLTEEET